MIFYELNKQQKVVGMVSSAIVEATLEEAINTAGKLKITTSSKLRNDCYYILFKRPNAETYMCFKILTEIQNNNQVEYTAVESAYDELASYSYIKDIRPQNHNAKQMLTQILSVTRYQVGYVADTPGKTTNFYYKSVLESLQELTNLFELEITFDVVFDANDNQIKRRLVNLYQQQGNRTGKRFEYGDKLLSVTKEQSSEELVTALVGRGSSVQVSEGSDGSPDGYSRKITFADVEWKKASGNPLDKPLGQEFLEDPSATALYGFSDGKPRIGIVEFSNIKDKNELIQATYEKLQELKRPKVSFKAAVTDVGDLALGDTVAIIRHDLQIEYLTRVYKVTHNLLNEQDNTVEFGDSFQSASITNKLSNIQQDVQSARERSESAVQAANGKNTNFYSSSKPSSAIEGDLWYKDLGNGETELYAWHNGNWELVVSTADTTAVERQIEQTKKEFAELDAKTQDLAQTQSEADKRLSDRIESVSSQAMADAQNLTNQLSQAQDTLNAKILDAQSTLDGKISTVSTDLSAKAQVISGIQQDLTAKQKSLDTLSKQSQSQGSAIGTLQSDVTGIKGQYADLSGNVNSLQASASGLQADMKDAKGNISSLQAKASGFEASMKNAQGDIASVQVDVNGLKTTVAGKVDNSTYATFVNQTKEKIELTATKLDNLSVGGRNLVAGTGKPFTMGYGISNTTWEKGKAVLHYDQEGKRTDLQSEILPQYPLPFSQFTLNKDGEYTQSIMVETDATFNKSEQMYFSWFTAQHGHMLQKAKVEKISDKVYRVSSTLKWTKDNAPLRLFDLSSLHRVFLIRTSGTYIAFYNPKLELGTIATDWTPAPEDTDASIADLTSKYSSLKVDTDGIHTQVGEIVKNVDGVKDRVSSAETSINQTKEAIEQKASKTEVDSLSGRVKTAESTLKHTADGLELTNQKLDGLSIGARNWLQGTADFSVKGGLRSNNIDAGNLTYSDYNDKIKMVRISEKTRYGGIYTPWGQAFPNGQLQVGDDYTFSFDAKGTGTFSKVTNEGENKAGLDGVALTSDWKRYSVTGKITALNKAYTIYFRGGYDVYIKCLKIERGTVATDWTPAPEDVDGQLTSLSSRINANSSELSSVYTKITKAKDDAVNTIKSDSKWGALSNIVTNSSFLQTPDGFAQQVSRQVEPKLDGMVNANLLKDTTNTMTKFEKILPYYKLGSYVLTEEDFNKEFTISCLYKGASEAYLEINFEKDKAPLKKIFTTHYKPTGDSQEWITQSFTVPAGAQNVYFYLWANDVKAGSTNYDYVDDRNVAQAKLEYGTKRTMWLPSGEELGTKETTEVINKVIDTADSHERIITNYLTGESSKFKQLANLFNVTVGDSGLTLANDGVLISGKKVHITGQTLIDNASIEGAKIKSLDASQITTGQLDAGKINVINLNASNITTGTIAGANLQLNLNTGYVTFMKGKLHNWDNTVDIDLDNRYLSTADSLGRIMFKGGSISITQPNIFDPDQETPYLQISNSVGSGSFSGGVIVGRDNIAITNSANKDSYFLTSGLTQAKFSGLFSGKSTYAGWQPTVIGGADRGVALVGGAKMPQASSIFAPSKPLLTGSPYIYVGVKPNGIDWWGDRVFIEGDYVHIPSVQRKTTSAGPNVWVAADGALLRSTSAKKYKTNITDAVGFNYGEKLIEMVPKLWIDKAEKENYHKDPKHYARPNFYYGLIADDLDKAGLSKLVRYDKNGEVEGIAYDRIAVALLPVIKGLKDKISKLEEKINE